MLWPTIERVQSLVYSFGDNTHGQLGCPIGTQWSLTPRTTPSLVRLPRWEVIISISAGRFHSLAVTTHGIVYGWGKNDGGELGVGDTGIRVVPNPVLFNLPPSMTNQMVPDLDESGLYQIHEETSLTSSLSSAEIIIPQKPTGRKRPLIPHKEAPAPVPTSHLIKSNLSLSSVSTWASRKPKNATSRSNLIRRLIDVIGGDSYTLALSVKVPVQEGKPISTHGGHGHGHGHGHSTHPNHHQHNPKHPSLHQNQPVEHPIEDYVEVCKITIMYQC